MASEPEISPKTKHRFGFSGTHKRATTVPQTADSSISSDDVLDSLTRQASSQVGLGDAHTKTLQILADDDPILSEEPTLSNVNELTSRTGGRFGHYAIVLMGIGAMVAVWFYSSGRTLFNSNLLNSLIQRTNVRSVFGNPVEIGVVSMISVVVASWVALRRRKLARFLNGPVN